MALFHSYHLPHKNQTKKRLSLSQRDKRSLTNPAVPPNLVLKRPSLPCTSMHAPFLTGGEPVDTYSPLGISDHPPESIHHKLDMLHSHQRQLSEIPGIVTTLLSHRFNVSFV